MKKVRERLPSAKAIRGCREKLAEIEQALPILRDETQRAFERLFGLEQNEARRSMNESARVDEHRALYGSVIRIQERLRELGNAVGGMASVPERLANLERLAIEAGFLEQTAPPPMVSPKRMPPTGKWKRGRQRRSKKPRKRS